FGTLAVSFVMGFAIERIVLRPLHNAPVLSVVVVFVGLLVIFNSVAGWIFGYEVQDFPSPFPSTKPFGSTVISFHELGTIAMAFAGVFVLHLFLRFTKIGLAMRAAALNPASSRLSGIPVGLMLSMGWGIAAMFGAIAGMMIAPKVFLDPHMMSSVLLYGMAAALIGGIDNPWGAFVGGIVVGVIEVMAGAYLVGPELKLSVAVLIIVAALIIKPSGMFGRKIVTRV
ncbi:MAG: branched-chain amino acid ABC transporter permease, partial [Burkholderiaceae bacterium]|nr:branched-chain amino acid ABC transporter permease [Burkholderiaceae bacterium]